MIKVMLNGMLKTYIFILDHKNYDNSSASRRSIL